MRYGDQDLDHRPFQFGVEVTPVQESPNAGLLASTPSRLKAWRSVTIKQTILALEGPLQECYRSSLLSLTAFALQPYQPHLIFIGICPEHKNSRLGPPSNLKLTYLLASFSMRCRCTISKPKGLRSSRSGPSSISKCPQYQSLRSTILRGPKTCHA